MRFVVNMRGRAWMRTMYVVPRRGSACAGSCHGHDDNPLPLYTSLAINGMIWYDQATDVLTGLAYTGKIFKERHFT